MDSPDNYKTSGLITYFGRLGIITKKEREIIEVFWFDKEASIVNPIIYAFDSYFCKNIQVLA